MGRRLAYGTLSLLASLLLAALVLALMGGFQLGTLVLIGLGMWIVQIVMTVYRVHAVEFTRFLEGWGKAAEPVETVYKTPVSMLQRWSVLEHDNQMEMPCSWPSCPACHPAPKQKPIRQVKQEMAYYDSVWASAQKIATQTVPRYYDKPWRSVQYDQGEWDYVLAVEWEGYRSFRRISRSTVEADPRGKETVFETVFGWLEAEVKQAWERDQKRKVEVTSFAEAQIISPGFAREVIGQMVYDTRTQILSVTTPELDYIRR